MSPWRAHLPALQWSISRKSSQACTCQLALLGANVIKSEPSYQYAESPASRVLIASLYVA